MVYRVKSTYSLSGIPLFIVILLLGFALGFIAVHLHTPSMMVPVQQPPIDINVTTSGGDGTTVLNTLREVACFPQMEVN
jgi:hypothetical protein